MRNWRQKIASKVRLRNQILKEALAEFLGVFILITFGNGSVAQWILGKGQFGSFLSVNWCWGLGVAMGVYASGGVSGGHINPAVTLALCVIGACPWRKLPIYILAQYLGAFLASACVFIVYYDALNHFDGGVRQVTGPNATAGIWATYPRDYVTSANAFGDQVLATAMLMIGILSITDKRNMNVPKHMVALSVGLLVFLIGASFGMNCGYAINPARDLSPRIFTAIAGWGSAPFSYRNYNYFWVPILGPHLGAIIGALMYNVLIAIHWEPESTPESRKMTECSNEALELEKEGK